MLAMDTINSDPAPQEAPVASEHLPEPSPDKPQPQEDVAASEAAPETSVGGATETAAQVIHTNVESDGSVSEVKKDEAADGTSEVNSKPPVNRNSTPNPKSAGKDGKKKKANKPDAKVAKQAETPTCSMEVSDAAVATPAATSEVAASAPEPEAAPASAGKLSQPRTSKTPRNRGKGKADQARTADSAKAKGPSAGPSPAREAVALTPESKAEPATPKSEPYRNPNRVLTGGVDKKRLTPEELEAKMADIRLRNELLIKKQEAVQADKEQFTQLEAEERERNKLENEKRRAADAERRAAERSRAAENRRVQDNLRREREENATRKAIAFSGREWDAGKDERVMPSYHDRRDSDRGSYSNRRQNDSYRDNHDGDRGDPNPRTSYRQGSGSGGRRYMDRGDQANRGANNNFATPQRTAPVPATTPSLAKVEPTKVTSKQDLAPVATFNAVKTTSSRSWGDV
ncbi:hypothetical protein DFJ77DRAFT_450794 [Powellomyces hirtus]|nr:hypothetical protein DFJ77DRAFT_450794 [Powellomyces hirtus]